MVEDIDVQSDPGVVDRCVQFFTSHGEFEKAIDLLVKVGKVHIMEWIFLSLHSITT